MSSGIISVGMTHIGFDLLSGILLAVCLVSYPVLVALTVWRIAAYRSAVVHDIMDSRRAFGFFTFIAGTNVLGVRLSMEGLHLTTALLLSVAAVAWLVLGYVVPWTAVLATRERPVIAKANGTWFVWVVASQSVAVAAATLEPFYTDMRRALALVAVLSWSVGIFLYAAAGVFVAARMMQYTLEPDDLTPSYWISMGACSITVLAGARIVEMADAPMVDATRGLIAGLAVVFWAFATWLIPPLIAAGWWRHYVHRVPLRYDSALWGIVFPLGMYAVAGIYLGQANQLPLVGSVGSAELWVAFAAWAATIAAMVVHLWRTVLFPAPSTGNADEPADDRP